MELLLSCGLVSMRRNTSLQAEQHLTTVICHLLCCGEDLVQLEDRDTIWDIYAI